MKADHFSPSTQMKKTILLLLFLTWGICMVYFKYSKPAEFKRILKLHRGVCHKGEVRFDNQSLTREMEQFLKVYNNRPSENFMGSPMMHQFAIWCIIRQLKPKHIIESGIYKGLGTWIARQAAPDAQLILLDPSNRNDLVYKDQKYDTLYFTGKKFRDFGSISNWTDVHLDFSKTLAFIDDHNTPFKRIPQGQKVGIKNYIFEDNYWLGFSDCFSLKQGCACLMKAKECAMFTMKDSYGSINRLLQQNDLKYFQKVFDSIKIYQEIPMMFSVSRNVLAISANSTNYVYKTKDGAELLKRLGLVNQPPPNQFNGDYTYFNIAYVELY